MSDAPTEQPLFPDAATITALKPDGRDPTLTHVHVRKRKTVSVPTPAVERLGLAVGVEWTGDLAAACEHAFEVRRAMRRGATLLKHGERTITELRATLEGSGFTSGVAAEAVETLSKKGLVSDTRAASVEIDRRLRRGPVSREVLEERLLARGIDPLAAEAAVAGATGDESTADLALRAAYAVFETLPDGLTPLAAWRRVLSGLARRGFEDDVAQDAARRVLGDPPEDSGA